MRIPSSQLNSVPSFPRERSAIVQQSFKPEDASEDSQQRNAPELADSGRRIERVGPLSSLRATERSDSHLPLQTQRALAAFASNEPTIEQRLGIEIAGIDVYA